MSNPSQIGSTRDFHAGEPARGPSSSSGPGHRESGDEGAPHPAGPRAPRSMNERRSPALRAIDSHPDHGHNEPSGTLQYFKKLIKSTLLPALVPQRLVVLRGSARDNQVALTFDDGPDRLTGRYLDLLDRLAVRATFFLIGKQIEPDPRMINEYLCRGHEVASHGHSHRKFPTLSSAELRDELRRTSALLPPAVGMQLVRPPHGAVSARSVASCAFFGFSTVMWSLNSMDYKLRDGRGVAAQISSQPVSGGEIILLHEGQEWTLSALPLIVESLRQRGFTLSTVGDMLKRRPR